MTQTEVKQQLKNECLNRVLYIHSKYFKYMDNHYDDSYCEQRDYEVKKAVEKLEKELEKLKQK